MPTYGWIREDDWEEFLAGTERLPDPGAPLAPSFQCPFCSHQFGDTNRLRLHVDADHKVARPILLIDGAEPGSEGIVRRAYTTRSFEVVNCTAAELVIGGAKKIRTTPWQVGPHLAALRQERVTITLVNAAQKAMAPVVATYDLRFRIAERHVLVGVEKAFLEKIEAQAFSLDSIHDFLADGRCAGAAADYAEGIAAYATGVLLKERPAGQSITLPLSQYRDRFRASLQALSQHRRPLADLLCSLMRFALNELSGPSMPTGYWDLDVAAAMLRGPDRFPEALLKAGPSLSGRRRPVCAVDHGLGRVLELSVRMARAARWSPALLEECQQVVDAQTLDLMDRQKALAVWAITALRLNVAKDALVPLSQLSAIYPFSSWAEPCLEAISH